MKPYKQTKMYPALEARIKTQEARIHRSVVIAFLTLNNSLPTTTEGSYQTRREKR